MPDIPLPVFEHFCSQLGDRSPAYFLMNQDGGVHQWGGRLAALGIASPQPGQHISDVLSFMEGLLPLDTPVLSLPKINNAPGTILDAHVFHTADGYALVVMDATAIHDRMAPWQQKTNELALLCEKQAREIEQYKTRRGVFNMDETDFKFFFNAINVAAMELTPDGAFALIGDPPAWMHRFCPDINSCSQLLPHHTFGFLENFLGEARDFWKLGTIGCIKSGIWIETDSEQNEFLLEATAVNTRNKKMLVIMNDQCMFKEKQSLIQKGRELALDYHTLERMQEKLQRARDELDERVRERTAELETANARIARELDERRRIEKENAQILAQLQKSQKMEAIGTLAGGIAHDFNNILSAVIGFTEISLFESDNASNMSKNLTQILNAALRAKKLVQQILTFSHQATEKKKPVNVKRIIKEGLSLIRASLPSSIDIRHHLNSDGYVFADPTQIHQVIMNLCTNSGHAMRHSGGQLTIRLQDLTIDSEMAMGFHGLSPGNYIQLCVEDTGHGVPPHILNRIFDPFFTTKQRGEGTGMGLSVVHGIIQSCHGSISVESTPGHSTQFIVLLPAFDKEHVLVSLKDQPIARGSERILFVDDEPSQAELAIHRLGKLGYNVVALTDSEEALNLFAVNPNKYDLVITDLTMPKMTGKMLAQELLKVRPDLPIILCSGYSESFSEDLASETAIKCYLMKPIVLGEMAKAIRRVLDSP